MGRKSKFGEPTQAIRVPLSKLDQVMQLLESDDSDSVQNSDSSHEEKESSGFFVRNQEGLQVEIPEYAVEPVLQLADALKFLHENENSKACWSIRFNIDDLWNRLPIYRAESAKLKLMGKLLPDGEVCQVVGYQVALSKYGDLSTGVDLKFANGTVYHYGAHRVRLFVEGDRYLVGDK